MLFIEESVLTFFNDLVGLQGRFALSSLKGGETSLLVTTFAKKFIFPCLALSPKGFLFVLSGLEE